MKKVLINYANERFESVRKVNTWTGKRIAGFDRVIEYTSENIDSGFYDRNRKILEQQRGNGLWLWKPYFIKKALLEEVDDGDYLFYCDSGAFFVRNINPLIEEMQGDIWVSDLPLIEKQWTKKSALDELCKNAPEIADTNQIQASFLLLRKSEASVKLIDEWLHLCCREQLIKPLDTDEEAGACIAHREDQSLLSILCKQKKVIPQRDPSLFGRFPEGYRGEGYVYTEPCHSNQYKTLIVLHRLDYIRIRTFLRFTLAAYLPYPLAKMICS